MKHAKKINITRVVQYKGRKYTCKFYHCLSDSRFEIDGAVYNELIHLKECNGYALKLFLDSEYILAIVYQKRIYLVPYVEDYENFSNSCFAPVKISRPVLEACIWAAFVALADCLYENNLLQWSIIAFLLCLLYEKISFYLLNHPKYRKGLKKVLWLGITFLFALLIILIIWLAVKK